MGAGSKGEVEQQGRDILESILVMRLRPRLRLLCLCCRRLQFRFEHGNQAPHCSPPPSSRRETHTTLGYSTM